MGLDSKILQHRQRLTDAVAALEARYWDNEPIETLVAELASSFDGIIADLWHQHFANTTGCALFAVGGCYPVDDNQGFR